MLEREGQVGDGESAECVIEWAMSEAASRAVLGEQTGKPRATSGHKADQEGERVGKGDAGGVVVSACSDASTALDGLGRKKGDSYGWSCHYVVGKEVEGAGHAVVVVVGGGDVQQEDRGLAGRPEERKNLDNRRGRGG